MCEGINVWMHNCKNVWMNVICMTVRTVDNCIWRVNSMKRDTHVRWEAEWHCSTTHSANFLGDGLIVESKSPFRVFSPPRRSLLPKPLFQVFDLASFHSFDFFPFLWKLPTVFSHACLVGFNHSFTHALFHSRVLKCLFVYAFKRYETVLRILLQHIIIKKE